MCRVLSKATAGSTGRFQREISDASPSSLIPVRDKVTQKTDFLVGISMLDIDIQDDTT